MGEQETSVPQTAESAPFDEEKNQEEINELLTHTIQGPVTGNLGTYMEDTKAAIRRIHDKREARMNQNTGENFKK